MSEQTKDEKPITLKRANLLNLAKTHPMPDKKDELTKVREGVFITGTGGEKKLAEFLLFQLKGAHPESEGWYCPGGLHEGVFRDTDKKWYAYRHHAQYR